jgi:hypothetical protein
LLDSGDPTDNWSGFLSVRFAIINAPNGTVGADIARP